MLAAGAAVVRGVSPVIERLKRVTLPGGEQRLWSPDLEGYEHPITLAPQSQPNEIGLHTHNNREVLVHEGLELPHHRQRILEQIPLQRAQL